MDQRSRPSSLLFQRLISSLDFGSINILVTTETPSKLAHINTAIDGFGLPTEVRSFGSFVSDPLDVDENGGCYKINVAKKIAKAHQVLRTIDENSRMERARELGMNLHRCILIGEDSGFGFVDRGLRYEPEFAHLSDVLDILPGPGDPWPGVETKPIIWACGGPAKFFALIGAVAQRRDVDPRIINDSWMLATPLLHPTWKTYAHGQITSTFLTKPRDSGHNGIDHFLIPNVDCNKGTYFTEAELEQGSTGYKASQSPKALACQDMIRNLRVDPALALPRMPPANTGIMEAGLR